MTREQHYAAIRKMKTIEVKPVNGCYVLPVKVWRLMQRLAKGFK